MKTLLFAALVLSTVTAQAQSQQGSLLQSLKQRFGAAVKCQTLAGTADVCTFSSVSSSQPSFRYSRAIAIVIPHMVGGAPAISKPRKVMIHIQGFRGVCRRASDGVVDTNFSALETLQNFNLINQFVSATRAAGAADSVLVFPISTGKNDDYRAQLVGQFDGFLKWIDHAVTPVAGAGLYISGHSGAGSIIPAGLANSRAGVARTKAILLQDATYGTGRTATFVSFARANRGLFIESIYIPGSATQQGSLALKAQATANRATVLTQSTVGHCKVPNQYYAASLKKALAP